MKEVLNFVVKHLSYSEYFNFLVPVNQKTLISEHTPHKTLKLISYIFLNLCFKVIYLEERQSFLIQYLKYCDITLFSFILIFIKIEPPKYKALLDF